MGRTNPDFQRKAELLPHNTAQSAPFSTWKAKPTFASAAPQSPGSTGFWERTGKPLWCKAEEMTEGTYADSRHSSDVTVWQHAPCFPIFKARLFYGSAWKPGCRAVLRHGFNFCSSYLKNPVPVCQKKVNERFSCAHNHVSVGFGSCELMPEIFGGCPLWSSLIHNQCPINLQQPNYNDYWPFPTRTKTQWVTAVLFALGYSHIHAHDALSLHLEQFCARGHRNTVLRLKNLLLQKDLEPILDAPLLTGTHSYCIWSDSSLFRVSIEAKE